MQNNDWIEILRQRGKDQGVVDCAENAKTTRQPHREVAISKPTALEPPLLPKDSVLPFVQPKEKQTQTRRRKMNLVEASLTACSLRLQHFALPEIADKLNVSVRQASRYVERGKQHLGVPEGLRSAAIAEAAQAIKSAWIEYQKTEDPRVKVLWFKMVLAAMSYRDRLLSLHAEKATTELPKIQV